MPRSRIPGCLAQPGIRYGLLPADSTRARRRVDPRLHPEHRLLHHASSGRRTHRPIHQQCDRIPHAQSLNWGLAAALACVSSRMRSDHVLALQPLHRHRQDENGVTDMFGQPPRLCNPAWPRAAPGLQAGLHSHLPVPDRSPPGDHPLSFNAEPYFTFTEGSFGWTPMHTPCAGTTRYDRTRTGSSPCATVSSSAPLRRCSQPRSARLPPSV